MTLIAYFTIQITSNYSYMQQLCTGFIIISVCTSKHASPEQGQSRRKKSRIFLLHLHLVFSSLLAEKNFSPFSFITLNFTCLNVAKLIMIITLCQMKIVSVWVLMSLNIPSNFHTFTVLQMSLQLYPQMARDYRAYQ